jgi:hypothetical protein
VYEIVVKDKVVLGPEAESIETFTPAELKNAIAKTPEQFGDSYFFVLEHFYPAFLPKDYVYRWHKI